MKYTYLIFIVLSHFISCSLYANDPYVNLKVLPLNKWGWFQDNNKIKLREFIQKYKPKTIVELGSFLGESTVFLASHCDPDCKIYAVDIWKETPECKDGMRFRKMSEHEINVFFSQFYEQFLSNIVHFKLTKKVIPVRMTTIEASKELDISADLIYLDACHSTEEVCNDIMHWYPKVAFGGMMCGDDWCWPTVREAVRLCASELNQTINTKGNFWWFNPKG